MSSSQRYGFSLIEIMISISLIALILSFGLLSFRYLNKSLVRSDMEKLYSICTYLQQLAIVTNKKQMLTFDINQNCYHYQNHKERLNPYTIFGFVSKNIKGPPSRPTRTINTPISFICNKITFTPRGISQSGTIYMTDKNRRYQFALTTPVSQISFLRKYQYDNETWNYIP